MATLKNRGHIAHLEVIGVMLIIKIIFLIYQNFDTTCRFFCLDESSQKKLSLNKKRIQTENLELQTGKSEQKSNRIAKRQMRKDGQKKISAFSVS